MTTSEINSLIARLSEAMLTLETTYIEQEGEVTPETEAQEAVIADLKALLTTEGVDSLGRWLKAKQDEIEEAKAEKAHAERRLQAHVKTEAYIKGKVAEILRITQTEKVKGTYFSFAQATSSKSTVLTDDLNAAWLDTVQNAARAAGLPEWVNVQLKATSTDLKAAGEAAAPFLEVTDTPSVKFTKPRAV